MKEFARLYAELDSTTSTNKKISLLVNYFEHTGPADLIWAVKLLAGQRRRRFLSSQQVRGWLTDLTGYPPWLVEETYAVVGDLSETVSLMLEPFATPRTDPPSLAYLLNEELPMLASASAEQQAQLVQQRWLEFNTLHRYLYNKIMLGGFRVGVSKQTVVKALAKWLDVEPAEMAFRLSGELPATMEGYEQITRTHRSETSSPAKPYPFYLAYPLAGEPSELGPPDDWLAEWKWDGIRGQIIRRQDQVYIWSRGDELITASFPDLVAAAESLPNGTVLDAEIVALEQDGSPAPFSTLQQRLGRKNLSARLMKNNPAGMIAYDLLEGGGEDLRALPQTERRALLEGVITKLDRQPTFQLSPLVDVASWSDLTSQRTRARDKRAEGLMLKRKTATYRAGRRRGDWWKWKVDPLVIDAVLLYAQAGHGRRANLYTDYTLAVWDEDQTLVPIAKAYSGLTDEEINKLDRWIKSHTKEKFGPVRSVEPGQVLEIAFEGIAQSKRHKSGFALRFPRINRWRTDKPVEEADTLSNVCALWASYHGG